MKNRTFRQFILSFLYQSSALGDLAGDYKQDWRDGFRPTKLTPLILYCRLEEQGACSGAFDAVQQVTRLWCGETGDQEPSRKLNDYKQGEI